ncbi:MAG: EamA family transporter [Candidatus Peribacteria bacterium]|nr:MAG: EamA family transporter [Candidatus Peribacteria bacterium]
MFFRAESKKAGTLNAQAGRFLLFASSLRVIIYLISFLLVAEFGIVQATLLGMLTLVANIVFAYIFLHEKPGMKEIIITLLVITCVCI